MVARRRILSERATTVTLRGTTFETVLAQHMLHTGGAMFASTCARQSAPLFSTSTAGPHRARSQSRGGRRVPSEVGHRASTRNLLTTLSDSLATACANVYSHVQHD